MVNCQLPLLRRVLGWGFWALFLAQVLHFWWNKKQNWTQIWRIKHIFTDFKLSKLFNLMPWLPCTLYLIPCTLYLIPCTLYPVPCTLYSVPSRIRALDPDEVVLIFWIRVFFLCTHFQWMVNCQLPLLRRVLGWGFWALFLAQVLHFWGNKKQNWTQI